MEIPENALPVVIENFRKYNRISSNGKFSIFGGVFFVSKPSLETETQISLYSFQVFPESLGATLEN